MIASLWLAISAPANASQVDGLAWSWPVERRHSYYLETEVQLPLFMWFVADYNKQARVAAFTLRMQIDCVSIAALKKGVELSCDVVEAGLQAGAVEGDKGLLQPILEEMDAKLEASRLQIVLRNDGKVANLDLEEVNQRNRRSSLMKENLRLIVGRAVAGLDLRLPRKGSSAEGVWAEYDSMLLHAPTPTRTSGGAEVVHGVIGEEAGTVKIASSGRGVMVLGETAYTNNYDTRFEAKGQFDRNEGLITQRTWTVIGDPTASSVVAQGTRGVPYAQRGTLLRLAPGERVEVGETLEVAPPGVQQSTLQLWQHLGTDISVLSAAN